MGGTIRIGRRIFTCTSEEMGMLLSTCTDRVLSSTSRSPTLALTLALHPPVLTARSGGVLERGEWSELLNSRVSSGMLASICKRMGNSMGESRRREGSDSRSPPPACDGQTISRKFASIQEGEGEWEEKKKRKH